MKYFFILSILFLSACSGANGLNLSKYPDPNATKDNFIYCYGYGCTKSVHLGFNKSQWKSIERIFKKKPAKTAEIERNKIGRAIALMEQYTGKLAGTENDLPKAPITRRSYQELDCVDETINTSKYLKFLADANLLKFHVVSKPAFKGGLINGVYPHNTATVKVVETGEVYVIDSYIFKNGAQPNIRGLDSWLNYRVEELEKANNLNHL